MTALIDIELDAPSTPVQQSNARLPWVLFLTTLILLLGSLADLLRLQSAASQPTAVRINPSPQIDATWSDGVAGISPGPTTVRDHTGAVVAVVLYVQPRTSEPVWCQLIVAGTVIENQARRGAPAICVWVRDVLRYS